MHMKSMLAAAMALSLVIGSITTATTAHADGRGHDRRDHAVDADSRGHRDHHDHRDRDHRRDYGDHDGDRRNDGDYRRGYLQGRHDAGRYIRPHGYYHHSWRRGERLPVAYYGKRYVVRNYSAYRLRSPPRGYHWVRVDRDVVLAAVTTGVVVSIVSDLFR
jgi:Ni/Co efflux regulator RcnB